MHWFFPRFVGGTGAVGLLALRLAMGAAFVLHGWPKIQAPTEWATKIGMTDVPPYMQAAAAVSEFGGGIALILGLLTPLAALGIGATMATAFMKVHIHDPFVGQGKTSELPVLFIACAILFLLTGPGKISGDYLLFRRPQPPAGPSA